MVLPVQQIATAAAWLQQTLSTAAVMILKQPKAFVWSRRHLLLRDKQSLMLMSQNTVNGNVTPINLSLSYLRQSFTTRLWVKMSKIKCFSPWLQSIVNLIEWTFTFVTQRVMYSVLNALITRRTFAAKKKMVPYSPEFKSHIIWPWTENCFSMIMMRTLRPQWSMPIILCLVLMCLHMLSLKLKHRWNSKVFKLKGKLSQDF